MVGSSYRIKSSVSFRHQRGFSVIAAILFVVTMIFAIGTFLAVSGRSASDKTQSLGSEIQLFSAVNATRLMLAQCILKYPAGNNGGATFLKYPAGTGAALSGLECPGAPVGRKSLWYGDGGFSIPKETTGYSMTYTNGASGVFVTITSSAGSSDPVLSFLEQRFHSSNISRSGASISVFFVRP